MHSTVGRIGKIESILIYNERTSLLFILLQIPGIYLTVKVKVQDSRNRPGVAQRVPGSLGSQIFMTFGT
jgi:hypothetical protein